MSSMVALQETHWPNREILLRESQQEALQAIAENGAEAGALATVQMGIIEERLGWQSTLTNTEPSATTTAVIGDEVYTEDSLRGDVKEEANTITGIIGEDTRIENLNTNGDEANAPGESVAALQIDANREIIFDASFVAGADAAELRRVNAHETEHTKQEVDRGTFSLSPVAVVQDQRVLVGEILENRLNTPISIDAVTVALNTQTIALDPEAEELAGLSRTAYRERGAMEEEGGLANASRSYIADYWNPTQQTISHLSAHGADGVSLVESAGLTEEGYLETRATILAHGVADVLQEQDQIVEALDSEVASD